MEQQFRIYVNGDPHAAAADQTIASLLESLGIQRDRVAVEMNKDLVRKRDWDCTYVPDGAHLEIVEFVGGG